MSLRRIPLWAILCAALSSPGAAASETIRVPQDRATIQAAVDAALDGDVVLVAPGVYHEAIVISGKRVTLASEFQTTGDPARIEDTILEGGGNGVGDVINVSSNVQPPGARVIGFTIRNANNGVATRGWVDVLHCRLSGHVDAVDFSGGGGLLADNVFELNTDDGIDVDHRVAFTAERNLMWHNKEGVEIRLDPYTGPTLNLVMRDNVFAGNVEDGVQIIDELGKTDASDRLIVIERNLFAYNPLVAIGLMDGGASSEDLRAASVLDPIRVLNNTFVGNRNGIAGGDEMVVVNNLFVDTTELALKNVDGDSIAAHDGFWNNGTDAVGSNVDAGTTLAADPRLDADQIFLPGSPAIDAGTDSFVHGGERVLDLDPSEYDGAAPDLGAFEFAPPPGVRVESRVASGSDDAAEASGGSVALGQTELLVVGTNAVVGLRFDDVAVPPGAQILEAYVQLRANRSGPSAATSFTVGGEASPDPASFAALSRDLSLRPRAATSVPWSPPFWLRVGEAFWHQRTPDLSALVQELVDQPGWASGNALAFFVSGIGERRTAAFELRPDWAPLLHVRYAPPNAPPAVAILSPAPDATLLDRPFQLSGSAEDPEQGDLGAALVWTSSRDGVLGTGASLTADLSVGSHSITASVDDAQGAHGEAQIEVTIVSAALGCGIGPELSALLLLLAPLASRRFSSRAPR